MPDLARLAAAARAMLPPGVAVAATDPRADWPADPDCPPGVVARRAREFAAGRGAVRQAMAELGLPAAPVPMGTDRAPVWPAGITGSITHSTTACLVAVARSDVITAIGLDLADDQALDPALWPIICRPEELDWLTSQPAARQGTLAMTIFSAKEAAYKAQYSLTRGLLGFDALQIRLTDTGFTALLMTSVAGLAEGTQIRGQTVQIERHILCVARCPS